MLLALNPHHVHGQFHDFAEPLTVLGTCTSCRNFGMTTDQRYGNQVINKLLVMSCATFQVFWLHGRKRFFTYDF